MGRSMTSAPFKTPVGVASFAQNLFKPRAVNEGGALKYGCTAIFKVGDDRSAFDAAAKEVILGRWHENGLVRAKQGLIKLPFLDGNGPSAKSKRTGEFWPGFVPAPGSFARPRVPTARRSCATATPTSRRHRKKFIPVATAFGCRTPTPGAPQSGTASLQHDHVSKKG